MTIMPPTLFFVVRDYGKYGIGSTDPAFNASDAFDEFCEAVSDDNPVTVWQVDTYGGLPVRITDQTDRFEHEMQELCMARKLEWKEVIRFDDALPRYAAE